MNSYISCVVSRATFGPECVCENLKGKAAIAVMRRFPEALRTFTTWLWRSTERAATTAVRRGAFKRVQT